MTIRETIPDGLRCEVDAALEWFNRHEGVSFEVTGILDPETALVTSGARDIRLVLCGGDRCEQRTFRVTANGDDFDVAFADDPSSAEDHEAPPPELDPPPGARRGWLDRALATHAFVVIVFYRGFW